MPTIRFVFFILGKSVFKVNNVPDTEVGLYKNHYHSKDSYNH